MKKFTLPVFLILITLICFGCGKSSNEFLGDSYYDGLDALSAMDKIIDEEISSDSAYSTLSACYDKIDAAIKDSDNKSSISYSNSKKLLDQLFACQTSATNVGIGKISGSTSKPMNEFTKERNKFATILGKASRKLPY